MGSVGAELAELAASAAPVESFRAEALAVIERVVGCDAAIMWRLDRVDATVRGFSRAFWDRFRDEDRYQSELVPLLGAVSSGGVVPDREIFSLRDRSRMMFYSDIVRPLGVSSFVTGLALVRGRPLATVQLARTGTPFTRRNMEQLRLALPALALGEAVREHQRPSVTGLSKREREIVEYARLGFTAAEISLALGTSVHTVRNQLARLYRKLGVANRAELVAVLAS